MEKTNETSMSYDEVKKMALESPLVRLLVRLSELKVQPNCMVLYKGNPLSFSESAFDSLLRLVGIPLSLQKKVDSALGVQSRLHMVNALNEAFTMRKSKEIMLVGNPANSTIIGVTESNGILSAESFFELTEGIINKYGMTVQACSIGTAGQVSIRATAKSIAQIKGLDAGYKVDEAYLPGLSFENSILNGTAMNPFTHRMVCSNGLVREVKGESIYLAGFDSKELKKFYTQVKGLANNNFVSFDYNSRVLSAIKNTASMAELQFAAKVIENSAGVGPKISNTFVPFYTCADRYKKLGISIDSCSTKQLENARTDVPVWDVVNALTNFASHKHNGIDVTPASRALAQSHAGELLSKKAFDTQHLMPSLI